MKGVCLISGGIDSAVAAKLLMNKGVDVVFLHAVVNEESEEKVKSIVNELINEPVIKFYEHNSFLNRVVENCDNKYTCVLCKREMYKQAEKLCEEVGASFIITGESIGQVASQTVENLNVLDQSVNIPIIRPLIGLSKNEIIKLAKEFNTYELSIKHALPCPFVPDKPSTRARLKRILIEEEKLD